jgi:hypothetical protein
LKKHSESIQLLCSQSRAFSADGCGSSEELPNGDLPGPGSHGSMFAALSQAKVGAVFVASFTRFYREHSLIVVAAAAHEIPATYEWGELACPEGPMAYGQVLLDSIVVSPRMPRRSSREFSPAIFPLKSQPSSRW